MKSIVVIILLVIHSGNALLLNDCGAAQQSEQSLTCERGVVSERNYLFYDVNPGEGFNLRRDVYMRVAVLVKKLRQTADWVLVLPPWDRLFHWKSEDLGTQAKINWSLFFSIDSLRKFIPVMELSEFVRDKKKVIIDQVIILNHFQDAWDNGKWEEKYKFVRCKPDIMYRKDDNGMFEGWFWKSPDIRSSKVRCLAFQGHATKLAGVLHKLSIESEHSIMIDRAEIMLHDDYGSVDYWKARRSMRFSDRLYALANKFRQDHFQSSDEEDGPVLPDDWRDEEPVRIAKGGDYLCGHLRRQDFLVGRSHEVPSLKSAAEQLLLLAKSMNVSKVFIASDGTNQEMEELRDYLEGDNRKDPLRMLLYRPPLTTRRAVKDGGVAIVEQIICSRARHFIGSFESTFSFRIQEEREIMNFPAESTFNRFCGDAAGQCEQPAKWRILY